MIKCDFSMILVVFSYPDLEGGKNKNPELKHFFGGGGMVWLCWGDYFLI